MIKADMCYNHNFPHIRIVCRGEELLQALESITYDDGQGRNYDIIDDELYE
jgi:hypothetical protein